MPSNYLQEVDDEEPGSAAAAPPPPREETPEPAPAPTASEGGATATALYDYEAGEDNELSFPEDAVITNIVSVSDQRSCSQLMKRQTFPDEDWWHGEYGGRSGLFPANYTKIND